MSERRTPYRNVRYVLEIDGIERAGFSGCRLPSTTSSVIEYREGNDPPGPRLLSGLTRSGPLRLEYGISDDLELYEWRALVEQGDLAEARRAVAVNLLDATGNPGPRWEFRNAWPSRYVAPDLDALEEAVAVDLLEVTHEGFERVR